MVSFTCITCHVAFNNPDLQRSHYKTDWHRYNLKRKVAEVPPVTQEEFQRRVLLIKDNEKENENKCEYCQICRKNFSNFKAYQNHLNSKKHKENEKNVNTLEENVSNRNEESHKMKEDEIMSDESDIEEDENPINNNDCLFCSHHSRTFVKCLKHMSSEHSFFIPDIEYCTDVKGLLQYLAEKIFEGHMCLWCNETGKTFHSTQAAQQHMIDKGHCKMIYEGNALEEYIDFYDYSSSYPDANNVEDKDEEVEVPEIDGSDYQLVLPSGSTIGHRSLMRYYRQSIDPNRPKVTKSTKDLHKIIAHYKSIGWTATERELAAKKARDLYVMKQNEAKWRTKLGIKNNKLQKHFRSQTGF